MSQVFERFYRVEEDQRRDAAVAGLGLTIAKGIVEAHGGAIGIESTLGQGTSVCFMLRRQPCPSQCSQADVGRQYLLNVGGPREAVVRLRHGYARTCARRTVSLPTRADLEGREMLAKLLPDTPQEGGSRSADAALTLISKARLGLSCLF